MTEELDAASWSARWFDGRSTRGHDVTIRTALGRLLVLDHAGHVLRSVEAAECREGPCWTKGALSLALPDGSTAWISTPPHQPWLRPASGAQRLSLIGAWPSLVERAMSSTAAAILAVCLLLGLLVGLDRVGIGWAAKTALPLIPLSVDNALGDKAAELVVARSLASPRSIDKDRYNELRTRFAELAARLAPERQVRLEIFRLRNSAGFNAFALPNGYIVMLEGMAEALTDDEVMAVLGHELGHVVHRHGMQALLRQLGLLALAQVTFSDFSSVMVPLVAGVQNLHHSRDAEREADAYARWFCDAAGLPPGTLASVWRKIAKEAAASGAAMPVWLSTHPSTEEREAAARQR